jgi:hypothetical protein
MPTIIPLRGYLQGPRSGLGLRLCHAHENEYAEQADPPNPYPVTSCFVPTIYLLFPFYFKVEVLSASVITTLAQ